MWNEVVQVDSSRGVYEVCGKYWTVGKRYKLYEHIGAGSYGDVCRATDCDASMTVALKRVADVLCCPLLAKRVLREVCIMRRLSHPYVIGLTDVFTSMSVEIEGGVDLYIATEFADGGDMYHMKESLLIHDVKFLMWQLLTGVSYIHSCRVWHRDIKSENILLSSDLCVKICDFGLSRSAEESSSTETQKGSNSATKDVKRGLKRQYTKMVVTPSYRAPEVIMSRGEYGSAIDIWSLGCIFWELLVRYMNPNITGPPLRPLFGVREEPVTPGQGETYTSDKHSRLHEQLDVIFDVIGTPCWSDIKTVPSETWRSYLKHLPGRAGRLMKQMSGYVDDEALDLLSRMLTFDPSRRCTAEEALAHTYFKGLKRPEDMVRASFEVTRPGESVWKIKDPAVALDILERELEASVLEPDGGRQKLEWLLQREIEEQHQHNLFRHSLLASMNYLRRNIPVLPVPPVPDVSLPGVTGTSIMSMGMMSVVHQRQDTEEAEVPKKKSQQRKLLHTGTTPRVTRSSSAAAAAAAAAAATAAATPASVFMFDMPNGGVNNRSMRNAQVQQTQTQSQLQVQSQLEQNSDVVLLPRRSPRLNGELPHRKRLLCLRAG